MSSQRMRMGLVCFLVAMLHVLWLRTTTKWTEFWLFSSMVTTLNVLFVFLLYRSKWRAGFFGHVVLGILMGYWVCTIAWLVSDSIYAPDRVARMWLDASSSVMKFVEISLFTATITGCYLVGGVLAASRWVIQQRNCALRLELNWHERGIASVSAKD